MVLCETNEGVFYSSKISRQMKETIIIFNHVEFHIVNKKIRYKYVGNIKRWNRSKVLIGFYCKNIFIMWFIIFKVIIKINS